MQEIKNWEQQATISLDEIRSITGLNTYDPFKILGSHPLETDLGQKTVVRVYHPTASEITGIFIDDSAEFPFLKLGETGFFEAVLQMEYHPFKYKLRVKMFDGNGYEALDPYNFTPVLSEYDLFLLGKGNHYRMYEKLGANVLVHEGIKGVQFAVWAPSARAVSVVGNFNSWDGRRNLLRMRGNSGIWEIFIPDIDAGEIYKFEIHTQDGHRLEKVDPMAKWSEMRPSTASRVARLRDYHWQDQDWMRTKNALATYDQPVNIYEIHLGSWKRDPNDTDRFLNYEEMADELIPYMQYMGYTHIELMPLAEHPLDESWGYQVTGYFAVTSRYGSPKQLKIFIDKCHQAGIGVIMDWVPAHFPKDSHSLGRFDGTALYEHADPRQGEHPHWGTYIFNYGRTEVSNFLISNAIYWLREFHVDGLRVDAVASMLYLDYGKEPGEWIPNAEGGNINFEALEFMKHLNSIIRREVPRAILIAEESTSFPAISKAPEDGGLGYHYKWNMGWMNDFLSYVSKDPVHRKFHHNNLTFSMIYAYSESFILVLSHDEVVHGKGSMIEKMPGDLWQKFSNLRLAYAFMYGHPGKKLTFMGNEFAQFSEWKPKQSLDWHLCQWDNHQKMMEFSAALNHTYRNNRSLWEQDTRPGGFEWISCDDADSSIVSFFRRSTDGKELVLCICNFTPVPRDNYRIGAPAEGYWQEILNTDSEMFGGSNLGNDGGRWTEPTPWQGRPWSLSITLPPLAAVYFRWTAD